MQPQPVWLDLDTPDEKPDQAGLLGGEQLVLQGIEAVKGLTYLGLGERVVPFPNRAPGGDDDLGLAQQAPKPVDDGGFDLGRGPAAHHVGPIIKSALSDCRRAKVFQSVIGVTCDWLRIGGHPGNVGLSRWQRFPAVGDPDLFLTIIRRGAGKIRK